MNKLHYYEIENQGILFDGHNVEIYKIPDVHKNKVNEIKENILNTNYLKSSPQNDERNMLERLVIILSESCNLSCKYCYLHDCIDDNNVSECLMKLETMITGIDFILNKYNDGVGYIQFFGGEPLLNAGIIEEACKIIHEKFREKGLVIPKLTMVTNGTLINEKIIDIFNLYFDNITVSLDGMKQTNDDNRIYKNSNKSVYDEVLKNISKMKKYGKFKINIEMTVANNQIKNFVDDNDILDYKHICDLDVDQVHFCPNIEDSKNKYYGSEIFRNYFDACSKYSFNLNNKLSDFKKATIRKLLRDKETQEYFCMAGLSDITINYNGDIYPCFMFIGSKEYRMSNVFNYNETEFNSVFEKLSQNKIANNKECNSCWAQKICYAGCSGCIGTFNMVNGSICKPVVENCILSKKLLERVIYESIK
ncbi:radical SAM/SPASM domain-containing protein [Helicovermis profundi]|uniref:Thioether cross-link-forming SCIFF peptide maturase n=1 Tax=Helicovermis profundi TaxID=3065157 RepID=A0AAU9EX93_9FIRM|nr:thioether cross-link-forming SCIFF peptide maturase [Clostridia bacterium S502]